MATDKQFVNGFLEGLLEVRVRPMMGEFVLYCREKSVGSICDTASIIKEVLVTMAEVNNQEQNFEEMLEESLKSMNTDEKVHGVVVGISPTEVYVDVGRKQAGFIPANELSNDPSVKPEDVVKMGDELELLIMKTNDQEGTIMLSKRRVDAMKGWDVIEQPRGGRRLLRPRRR